VLRRRLAALLAGPLVVLLGAAPLAAQTIGVGPPEGLAVAPGDAIDIPIAVDMSAAGGLDIASLQFVFTWSPAQLSYVGNTPGNPPPGDWTVIPNETQTGSGELGIAMFSINGTTSSFTATTVTLQAGAGVPNGTCATLTLTVAAAGDALGNDLLSAIDPNPRYVVLCIGISGILGDVTDNGSVDIIDAQQVARHSVGLDAPNAPKMQDVGDVTEDGNINIIDAQQIARHAVGLGTPGAPNIGMQILGCDCSQTGNLEVTTATTGTNLDPDGYQLSVDAVASVPIGLNETHTFQDLSAGSHSVELDGVAANCSVSGDNPRTVSVPAGGTGSTTIAVSCAGETGNLEVTTATTGTNLDPDGYLLSVDGGQSTAIGLNETLTFQDLAAGNHSVLLDDVAANCSVSGDNPRTVNVPAGGTGSTSFAVSCADGGPPVLEDGVAVGPLSGAEDSEQFFMFVVPSTNTKPLLNISTWGGTGDADLYVRYGALPERFTYDCRSMHVYNDETCQFVDPAAGDWFIMIRGWSSFDGVMLVAELQEPNGVTGTWSGFGSDGSLDLEIILDPLLEASDGSLSGSGTVGVPGTTPDDFTITAGQRSGADVFFEMTVSGFTPFNFTGTWDGANLMDGVINESGFVDFPMTFNRTSALVSITASGSDSKQAATGEPGVVAGDVPFLERLRQIRQP
jgi:hypothetical protein